jgi:hypothetical protein
VHTFQITKAGNYLALPMASVTSPISYALLLDVFTQGIAPLPTSADGVAGNPFANLPLITVVSGVSQSPLTIQSIESIQTISVPVNSQPTGVIYHQYDPKTGQVEPNLPSDNNSTYIYSDVAIKLLNQTQQVITPLNQDVTATVYISAGVIQRVVLSEPLLFIADTGSAATSSNNFSLQLELPQVVVTSLPTNTAPPTYTVNSQSLALNNFVDEEQFSGQSGVANAGVYLSAGLSDQLPLYSSMGTWPVQNRVTYVATDAKNGTKTLVYLNGQINAAAEPYINAAELTLGEVYTNHDIVFSAASTPSAATIGGPAGSTYANSTFVAWVEASNPVIPIVGSSAADNYQAFIEAFYGNQRINYRINTGGTWSAPELTTLYKPNGAIIRNLQVVNVAVADPKLKQSPGQEERTLLVWSEASIAAIKGEVESFGSTGSTSTPIPTSIKAGWLNPNATTNQWNDLFVDVNGTTIQTIPWDPTPDVGEGIDDISIASLTLLANGSLVQTPVISWSQDVRTPYVQSVLNDQPSIYLKFDELQAGINTINIGTTKDTSSTSTFASDTGLDFAFPGPFPPPMQPPLQTSMALGC